MQTEPKQGRICFITHSAYPNEPRSRRMARALTEAGYVVDVVCLHVTGQPAEVWDEGVHVIRLPVTRHQGAKASVYLREYASFFLLAARLLAVRHRRNPYDLVQVFNPPDALIFSASWLKLRRVPLVLDLRELTPELFMSRFGLARRSAVVRLLTLQERLACALADAVIVLHERHRRIMLGRGVPPHKLVQVMNCPDERVFRPAEQPLIHRQDGVLRVIHHGGILERYGVDTLVQAVALVRGEIPGITLDLYGDGDYRPKVEALVAELGLTDCVRFHGQQPIEQMRDAILAADVGVAPLRQDVFTDCGLPTKLLEYVAVGLPAIASRTATTADYFDDSMVLLFEPGNARDLADKLLAVYREPEAAQARATQARRFTEQYNWTGERARYLDLIARLLKSVPSRRYRL